MDGNGLRDYLVQIGRYQLLTADQELELAYKMRSDNELTARRAKEKLINCNLRLVVSIAKNYKNVRLSLQDLISEGNLGLITAVEKYNPDLGYRFSTCATPWIKQAILKAITDHGKTIRLPAHVYQLMRKYRAAIDELNSKGEKITDEKLADMVGTTVEKINQLRQYKHDTLSLDMPLTDEEGGDTLGDLVADQSVETPEQYADRMGDKELIDNAMKELPERTQKILKMRYGLGTHGIDPEEFCSEHTLEAVGDYIGLTRERVRQIEKEALTKLKHVLERKW